MAVGEFAVGRLIVVATALAVVVVIASSGRAR